MNGNLAYYAIMLGCTIATKVKTACIFTPLDGRNTISSLKPSHYVLPKCTSAVCILLSFLHVPIKNGEMQKKFKKIKIFWGCTKSWVHVQQSETLHYMNVNCQTDSYIHNRSSTSYTSTGTRLLHFASRLSGVTRVNLWFTWSINGFRGYKDSQVCFMVSSKDSNQPQIHAVCFFLTTYLQSAVMME